jgi:hypothetical protein
MTSQQVRIALFGFLLLILLAAAGYLFLSGSGTSAPADYRESTNSAPESQATSEAHALPETAPARQGTADARTSTVEKPALPAAYEKALSGIFGRVVEPDGSPTPGSQVELIGGFLEFITLDIDKLLFEPDTYAVDITQQRQTTDKDGRFVFSKVDPRGYYLIGVNLGRGRPTFRLVDHTPMPGESVDLGEIRLDPWLTVRGRIVDEGGRGIANVRVRATTLPTIAFQTGIANLQPGTGILVRMGNGKNSPRILWNMPHWTDQIFDKLPFPAGLTQPDGTFSIEGAPSGALTLFMDGPAIPGGYKGPIPPSKGNEKHVGEIVMNRGLDVEGVVVDERDTPVPNSEVVVGIPSPLAADNVAFLRKPIKAGPDGRFVARGVPGPKAFFLGRGEGQAEFTIDDPQEVTGDEIKVKIPAPRSIVVKVEDSAGKPLTGRVAVQRAIEGLSLVPQLEPPLVTKPEVLSKGVYRIRGLKQGSYWVYARPEGYAVSKEKVDLSNDGDEPVTTIKCEPEFTVETTVFGKENGKPVPLEMATVGGAPDRGVERLGYLALGHAKTNKDGVALVRALGEGKFNILATHPAYAIGKAEVEIPGTRTATIQLMVGGNVEGVVTRGGVPPEKPLLVAIAPNGRGQEVFQLPRTSITDLEGKFRFTHLYPGKYSVVAVPRIFDGDVTKLDPTQFMKMASENARQECEVRDEEVTNMILDLNEGGRKQNADDGFISGSVFINGMAAEGDYVTAAGPEWIRPKPVDASGAFDLGRARPGTYQVSITRKSSTFRGPMGGSLMTRSVEVKATEPSFVEFNIRTGKLTGTVFNEARQPLPAARVTLRVANADFQNTPWVGQVSMRADDAGKFEIEEVAAGDYYISARDGESNATPAMVRVTDGSSTRADITVRTGVEFSGQLEGVAEKESRWANMQFQCKTTDGKSLPSDARADVNIKENSFRVGRMIPGRYSATLSVFHDDGMTTYKCSDFDVPAAGAKNVILKFEKSASSDAFPSPAAGGARRGR